MSHSFLKSTRSFQYEEIARQLRLRIQRGDFSQTGRLPSERSLVETYLVQRNTVRQALRRLESEGYIQIDPKRGSFVNSFKLQTQKNVLALSLPPDASIAMTLLMDGFTSMAKAKGFLVRRLDAGLDGVTIEAVPDPSQLGEDVAGIALWPQNPADSEALHRLNMVMPLVLLDRRVAGVATDTIHFDDVAGGRQVTEHLISNGHRRIAFLTDDAFAETVQNRWRGYVLAQEEAGIAVDPRLALLFKGLMVPLFPLAVRTLLEMEDRVTAFVCSNDLVALALMRLLHETGVRVPEDIALTGYGNMMPDYLEVLSITGISQPFFELGEAAAQVLIERQGVPSVERVHEPRSVVIPTALIVRNSSSVAR